MKEFFQDNAPMITQYGVKILGVIALLALAWIVASWGSRSTLKGLRRAHIDETLSKFTAKMVKWMILLFAVLGCLGLFGVSVTSFAAVLAASAFAIGLAFQGSLSNFSAGVMLLVFRPFKVGDVISVAGHTGKVDEIALFTTTMDTADNRRLIIPNSSVFGSTIENITHHPVRRVDVSVGTDYAADLDTTREILTQAARKVPDQVPDREVQVVLGELGASSVDWSVRVWVETSNYWSTKEALTRSVKNALDEADISIPFPQMDVHVQQQSSTGG